ncbi:hypothetical protein QFC21_003198 [Naganishia friedmannii]|uniref:Uncharacterized protein n=1 Tax=Naganishia friedmannii TaxID=89922 RepID=A0ACC2VR24_9TREE|nr:hypothetical protein QFC21_003198 [Naganishia friedmannii]
MPTGASATRSKAGRKRISNTIKPKRVSFSSSISTAASSSSSIPVRNNKAPKYIDSWWYWLLAFALPHGFFGALEIIETFDTYFYLKTVYNPAEPPTEKKDTWIDPFNVFIYIACELLLPLEPFGGFGHAKTPTFWGEKLSRNKVISKIVTYATGKDYDSKSISSHKQTMVKNLLLRYNDPKAEQFAREQAARALQQLVGITPLERFFKSYLEVEPNVDDVPSGKTGPTARELELHRSATLFVRKHKDLPPVQYREKSCQNRSVLALDPLLAFFLGLNGESSATISFQNYFAVDQPLPFGQTTSTFGREWWNRYIMIDTAEQKVEYAKGWWKNREAHGVGHEDNHGFCLTDDEPPESDGGQFKQRSASTGQHSSA